MMVLEEISGNTIFIRIHPQNTMDVCTSVFSFVEIFQSEPMWLTDQHTNISISKATCQLIVVSWLIQSVKVEFQRLKTLTISPVCRHSWASSEPPI